MALHTRDGVVEEAGPGRCRLTTGSWSWPALAATIARFDADFEVIGPPDLAEAFAHLAARFTRRPAPPADGLLDEPRPGRPRTVTDDQVEQVIARTLESSDCISTHPNGR